MSMIFVYSNNYAIYFFTPDKFSFYHLLEFIYVQPSYVIYFAI